METLQLFVVLLSVCSLSYSKECQPYLMENIDFPGTDITFLYSPDVKHCQYLCTQHPSCLFFTFIRQDWTTDNRNFYCYLKSTPTGQPNVQTPLLGVTSGFSLKTCNLNSKPCLSQVYQNIDFYGSDYRFLFTSSSDECQTFCSKDPNCHFFTFINDAYTPEKYRYKCHLKYSWSIPRTLIVKKEVGIVSGFSEQLQMSPYLEPACQRKLFANTNIPGNNLETLPAAGAEHCHALCSAHPTCTYFTYNNNDFNCYLKKNPNEMVKEAKVGVTSGIPSRFCQLDNDWLKVDYDGVHFQGSDIRNVTMENADKCRKACTADRQCQFYTYFKDSHSNSDYRGLCFMKSVITISAPPKVSKLNNVVSPHWITCFFWGLCFMKSVITMWAPPIVSKLNNVVSGFPLKSKC
ncbi:coagulation factor XI-like [Solea senegalensis]|uniref:Coagulation factor XI-like n=1 Tax=Solea senegalensis TaxID=28829 RepID=A0AAV6RAK7_SOLSE|nr:coagulation factor XI-like [Solea senegalensis]